MTIRLPSSYERLVCASWLIYATNATDDAARRVKALILHIKTDSVDSRTREPFVKLAIARATVRLATCDRSVFDGQPMLVPVPGSGLTKPRTVWPAKRVCEELVRQGCGEDVLPLIMRTAAVPKSAGSRSRPSLEQHVESLTVQRGITTPSRLMLVDDVVTSGTTLMACAIKLRLAFPDVPVSSFALSRVQSQGNPTDVFAPVLEQITISGQRCVRGPLTA